MASAHFKSVCRFICTRYINIRYHSSIHKLYNTLLFSNRKRNRILGIDIGTTSVKVLEFSKFGRSLVVERYGYEPIKQGMVIDNKIKDIEGVTSSVQRAVKLSGSKATRGAVCVHYSDVISREIAVQADMKEAALTDLVEIETDRIVPYNLDEVNFDFIDLGTSNRSTDENNVQIVVCKKNLIEDLVVVLEGVGIEPAIVDVDTFTLARIHKWMSKAKTSDATQSHASAMVDFGSHESRFMVFHEQRVIYQHSTSFGGKLLTDAMQKKYGTPYDEAIIALRKGDLPESFKAEILKPFVRSLVQEVLRALQFFYSSSTYNNITDLTVTGGCSHIGNLEKIIEKRINIPTSILNPLAFTKFGSRVDKKLLQRDIPSLGIASGLALRGVE